MRIVNVTLCDIYIYRYLKIQQIIKKKVLPQTAINQAIIPIKQLDNNH